MGKGQRAVQGGCCKWVLGGWVGRIGWTSSRYRPEGEAQPSSYSTNDKVGLSGSDRPLQVPWGGCLERAEGTLLS